MCCINVIILAAVCFLVVVEVLCLNVGTCQQRRNCKLPNCYCGGKSAPNNLFPAEVPQMIMFSFDDAVTPEINAMYEGLFSRGRLNPNGCPITMTMFVSHNFTDYNLVKKLYRRGHEVAVHSVTHRTPTTFWKNPSWDEMFYEVVEQRKILSENAEIPIRNITGWRSPFLQPSGEIQYTVLKEQKFEYDSTLTIATENGFSAKNWPNTLDFGWNLECNVRRCPLRKYPGLWEIPVQMLEIPNSDIGCLYADSCRPKTMEEAFQIFWVNFHNHYTGSRAPLFFTMHPSWLREQHNYEALNYFILVILRHYTDVYFVTYQQHLAWMKNPTKLDNILDFEPWYCSPLQVPTINSNKKNLQDPTNSALSMHPNIFHQFCYYLFISLCLFSYAKIL